MQEIHGGSDGDARDGQPLPKRLTDVGNINR